VALADLLILVQYFAGAEVVALLFGMLIILGVISLICALLTRPSQENHERRRRGTPYRYPLSQESELPVAGEPEEEVAPPLPSYARSPTHTDWRAPDTPSSSVGGTCLACGATVTEETSACCPDCGAERQRCPICQRYVAGGQDLLACIHCQAPGHANEMLAWVEQHETCPYCAHRIDRNDLRPPQPVVRPRRRKPRKT
jgi:hypothetical protein